MNIDAIYAAYVECALWSESIGDDFAGHVARTCDEAWAPDTSLLSFGFTRDDLAPETAKRMREDVEEFIGTPSIQIGLRFWADELGDDQIGHDFWLTRNGHGAGFWDRFGAGEGYSIGQDLSEAAKLEGESNLYVGDDGGLYVA